MEKLIIVMLLSLCSIHAMAFDTAQNIRGIVIDAVTEEPLAFATVTVEADGQKSATTTDSIGAFAFKEVPLGRYRLEASYLGYEATAIPDILVVSAKESVVTVLLKARQTELGEVVVRPHVTKSLPLNQAALTSARMLSVEEASRFAGGFDDPARLAASFAGVNTNLGDNGLVVRGNAPKFMQWRLEGIEIPNPNHFAEVASFGGGGLTAMSIQLLGNSDFFTGAFPAEYGNALSGVFDAKLRVGNNQQFEHAVQVGTLGVDIASEGPFRKGGSPSSYVFNYRYSGLGMVSDFNMSYHDMAFKLNFPTKKVGSFTLWGLGWYDHFAEDVEKDKDKWEYEDSKEQFDTKIYSGAVGASHRINFGSSAYLKTTLGATVNSIDTHTEQLDDNINLFPQSAIKLTNLNFVLSSYFNKRFSSRHTNRSGINLTWMRYDMTMRNTDAIPVPPTVVGDDTGNAGLLNAYSQSSFTLSKRWNANLGLTFQYFTLNKHFSIEPRAGVKFNIDSDKSVALAYGLHSRTELLNYYFTRNPAGELINLDLDFTRAHHLVASFDWNIGNNYHLKVEPYIQFIYNVPISPEGTFSFINLKDEWFVNEKLVSDGKGQNYGLDLTFEKFMTNGLYYMFTGSVFNARYKGADGIWRNTRYNRNFITNFLIGKEWRVGKTKRNTFSANINLGLQGGERYTPVDEDATLARPDKEVVYQEELAFSKQLPLAFLAHFTINYRINRRRVSHELGFKMLNATFYDEFKGHSYNYKTHSIDKIYEGIVMPNISYKLYF